MAETITIWPASWNRRATSPMRRTFSARSGREKPRSAHRPCRTLSPSSTNTLQPRSNRARSRASASVVLPAPDSPVIHTTAPSWPAR
ncbi:conserved hypothetical protein, partial [Ricinus communis]